MLELLNAAVGILVFYTLLSLIASGVLELALSALRMRGLVLLKAVKRIGGGSEAFADGTYANPLIRSLVEEDPEGPESVAILKGKGTIEGRLMYKVPRMKRNELTSCIDPHLLTRLVDVALPEWAGNASLVNAKEVIEDYDQAKYVALYGAWVEDATS